jgi:ariadne-1
MQINEGHGDCINCPAFKCKFIIDETLISSLVTHETHERYIRFLANSYIEKHPQIKWCPAKGCNYAIRKQGPQAGMVMCKCGFMWCWKCLKDGHWPASCAQIKWWNSMYEKETSDYDSESEAASVKWLLQFTQDCPKCTSPIQKNGGCNHMSCKKCGHQYCWVCLDKWESSHYSCSASDSTTSDERVHILNRIESNLSFRQFYLLHMKARQVNDKELKDHVIKLIQHLIVKKPDLVVDAIMTVVCRAIELSHLTRHIIMNICILGKYISDHEIKGSKLLKPEIKRLTTSISFLHSSLQTSWNLFSITDVELGIIGIKTAIRDFLRVFGSIYVQLKSKLEEAERLDKILPPKKNN